MFDYLNFVLLLHMAVEEFLCHGTVVLSVLQLSLFHIRQESFVVVVAFVVVVVYVNMLYLSHSAHQRNLL